MPQNTSVSGRVTHAVADLTGVTDDEVRLLVGLTVAGLTIAAALRTAQVLVDLGATFARHAGRSGGE